MSNDPIIKHLRDVLDYKWSGTGLIPSEVKSILDALAAKDTALSEMRAELERVKRENKSLSAELDALEEEGCGVDDDIRKLNDRATAAEAELERVKKALVDIELDITLADGISRGYDLKPTLAVIRELLAARALAPSIQDTPDLGARG